MQFANPIKPIKKHNFKHSEKTQNTADPTNHAKNSYMGCAVIFLFSRGSGENQRKNKTADPMNQEGLDPRKILGEPVPSVMASDLELWFLLL